MHRADTLSPPRIEFAEVISALSYALDITEGQPQGHAARSCMIGMRVAKQLSLADDDLSALFYGLLLKDLGCSSNASKLTCLFGADDHATKRDFKTVNWSSFLKSIRYVATHVSPDASFYQRIKQFLSVARAGQHAARELVALRCERGSEIARHLQLPESTALAIRALDEHWDGSGHPDGLRSQQIPLLARILGLSQTVEVFWQKGGLPAACEVAAARSGTWFDPEISRAFLSLRSDTSFWSRLSEKDVAAQASSFEPQTRTFSADDATLDRVAEGFSRVIDAKSPWTFCHSSGAAEVSVGIATVLNFTPARIRNLRRAALLHDIGKLGVSNLILDKPGKLNPDELTQMRRHPAFTYEILQRIQGFRQFADLAASHHERLDGKGYHRGLPASELSLDTRILAVADMYEALAAKRPYRQDLNGEQVHEILQKHLSTGIDPTAYAALQTFLSTSHFTPIQLAA